MIFVKTFLFVPTIPLFLREEDKKGLDNFVCL